MGWWMSCGKYRLGGGLLLARNKMGIRKVWVDGEGMTWSFKCFFFINGTVLWKYTANLEPMEKQNKTKQCYARKPRQITKFICLFIFIFLKQGCRRQPKISLTSIQYLLIDQNSLLPRCGGIQSCALFSNKGIIFFGGALVGHRALFGK